VASERKKILLRLDPAVHDALARWAGDELRSTNAQIEFLLRKALSDAGRMPRSAGRMRRPGRPAKNGPERDTTGDDLPERPESPERRESPEQTEPSEQPERPASNED
jgi:hypothetical protein